MQIRLYRRRHLLALSYRLLYRKKISISYGGRLEIQYTKKKTFENERNMIRYLKRAFVNCPARDTSKYYIRPLPPRIPILWPKVTTRWRRHESLKIIFYQYAEFDGTAHYEFRTRRRRFLSLGLTKLHTRPAHPCQ